MKLSNTQRYSSLIFVIKNVVIFMTCVIKDNGEFYPQMFLEEALFVETKCCCCFTDKTSN